MGRLSGKIAVVTGAGSGMGKACAQLFAREGAVVVATDIDTVAMEKCVAEARAEGCELDGLFPLDLIQPADNRKLVAYAGEKYGRIDVLLNAAAIPPHMAPTGEMDYEKQFRATLIGEVDITFLACQAAWPWMKKSGKASIINFSSVSARRSSPVFGMVAHAAGKAAVEAMSRQMAREGAPEIRVNTIAPGLVVTAMTDFAGAGEAARKDAILARVPLKRFGAPIEVAYCALFLASDEAAWITGSNYAVDGGTMSA